MSVISLVCHNQKVWPETRPNEFLTHWPYSLARRGDFRLGVLALGLGAFVLHCFMSHRWVGRAKAKSVPWLVTARFIFLCGECSWLLSVRLTLSLNVGPGRDGGCGCPSFANVRGGKFDLAGSSSPVGAVVFRGVIVRCLSMWWCGCRCLDASCGSERNGPLHRSLAILSPTEI